MNEANDFIRSWFKVEPLTGYKYSAIEKIKKGELKGNLDNFICEYPPDFKTMWVGEMSIEDMRAFALKLNKRYFSNQLIFFYLILAFFIGKGLHYIKKKFFIK